MDGISEDLGTCLGLATNWWYVFGHVICVFTHQTSKALGRGVGTNGTIWPWGYLACLGEDADNLHLVWPGDEHALWEGFMGC